MKGINKLKLLEFLEESSAAISDLLFIFTLPYGTSRGRAEHLLRKKYKQDARWEIENSEKRKFAYLLHHLRKDKLVEDVGHRSGRLMRLSAKGREILQKLRDRKSNALPNTHYEAREDDDLKIIIFDIPEDERRKRDWLRSALKNLKFSMLQKSVWAGKRKLPPRFLDDLKRQNIISYIDIFTINKRGSLRKLE